jgi:predicted nucleic acid-binding protein
MNLLESKRRARARRHVRQVLASRDPLVAFDLMSARVWHHARRRRRREFDAMLLAAQATLQRSRLDSKGE